MELHGREMADEFCLKMCDFHVTFRDLSHAVNLLYGTDGFTSPPKEGMLRISVKVRIRTRIILYTHGISERSRHYAVRRAAVWKHKDSIWRAFHDLLFPTQHIGLESAVVKDIS